MSAWQRRQSLLDGLQGQARPLRYADDGNAAQDFAIVTALISGVAPALDQTLGFVEMEGRNRYSGALSNMSDGERFGDLSRNRCLHKNP